MTSTYLTYTLPELQALKERWLAEGKRIARDLRLVVQTFGSPVESHYCCLTYMTLKTERAQAWLYEHSGPWQGAAFEHRAKVWVEVNDVCAARLYFRNGAVTTEIDSVYVPNPAIDELLAMAAGAQERVQAAANALDERERNKLIEVLGIGKIV